MTKGNIALHALSNTRRTARSDKLETHARNNVRRGRISCRWIARTYAKALSGSLLRALFKRGVLPKVNRSQNIFNVHLVSVVSGVQSLNDSLSSFRNEEKWISFCWRHGTIAKTRDLLSTNSIRLMTKIQTHQSVSTQLLILTTMHSFRPRCQSNPTANTWQ